jgi:acid-sensing ion channel 5
MGVSIAASKLASWLQEVRAGQGMGEKYDVEAEDGSTCSQRLLKRDDAIFREYIDNTTTHGVVRIFSRRSIVRRVFWLLIVLAATTGCLFNCINRIRFLASDPTSTSITIDRLQPINFPAVTFCNLNFLTRDGLNRRGILPLAARVLNAEPASLLNGLCDQYPELGDVILEDLIFEARPNLSTFLHACIFMGDSCKEDDFVPIKTTFGLCYTFNSGQNKEVHQTRGTGARQGLTVFLNVEQDQYVFAPSLDAGVSVVVLPQSEPPIPLDQGIAVSPGLNAFIGLTQRNFIDKTERSCRLESDVSDFNFLHSRFNFSASACSLDCFLTQIAYTCDCSYFPNQYPPDPSSYYAQLHPCSLQDICCVQLMALSPEQCDHCSAPCEAIQYTTFTSYASFPASYLVDSFVSAGFDDVSSNAVSINVYFESLNVENVTTTSAYSVIALLSDIGGQLGLFLGVSIISMIEFGVWLLDEFRDRCLCCVLGKKKAVQVVDDVETEMTEKCADEVPKRAGNSDMGVPD